MLFTAGPAPTGLTTGPGRRFVTVVAWGRGDGSAGSETSAIRADITEDPTVLALVILRDAPFDAVPHTVPGGRGGSYRGDIVSHPSLVGLPLGFIAHVILVAQLSIPTGSADGDFDAEVSADRGRRST